MEESFVSKHRTNVDKFYILAMRHMNLYKKLVGTKVIIHRTKSTSKYKSFFGETYTSEILDDTHVDILNAIILINKNDMYKSWDQQLDELEVYDNDHQLQRGDFVIYNRDEKAYTFKVVEEMSYSEKSQILYKYTLSPSKEIKIK